METISTAMPQGFTIIGKERKVTAINESAKDGGQKFELEKSMGSVTLDRGVVDQQATQIEGGGRARS